MGLSGGDPPGAGVLIIADADDTSLDVLDRAAVRMGGARADFFAGGLF